MTCCCCGDTSHTDAIAERETLSPVENRKVRDVFWLLVFLIGMGGSAWVARNGVQKGDLNVLRYGISSNSTLCGTGDELHNPKLVFCKNGTDTTATVFRVCAPLCPSNGDELVDIYRRKREEFVAASGISAAFWQADSHLLVRQLCVAPSISVMNRCLLDFSVLNTSLLGIFTISNTSNPGDKFLSSAPQMMLNSAHDIATAWYVILICGVCGGLVVSFIWIQLLRIFATPIVWLTIALFFFGMIAVDVLLAGKAGYYSGLDPTQPQGQAGVSTDTPAVENEYQRYYKILFWIFIGLTIVLSLILMFMIRRIQLSIALIHEAADFVRTVPQILLTPVLPVLLVGGVFMYGIFITSFLASCGTIEHGRLVWDRPLRKLMIYHIFFCLWVFFFLVGLHSVVMAGVVSSYYWVRDKDKLSSPVSKSIGRALRYHVGSIAFGSFILTVIKFARWALAYYSRQAKKLAGRNNPLIRFLLCCMNFCLWCFEKFIKFLTRNAYIMIAVDGQSFCKAAEQGWSLVMSNILRVTAVHLVTRYVFYLSKLVVGFACGVATTVWLDDRFVLTPDSDPVTSSFAPSLCACILGYFVASLFFEIMDFSIETLMLSFCLDDMRNSQTGNYYASSRLKRFMAAAPKLTANDSPL